MKVLLELFRAVAIWPVAIQTLANQLIGIQTVVI
jgi:hypothetical protein